LAGNRRCCCCPCGRTAFRRAGLEPARRCRALPRSNRHLHHRLADVFAPAIEKARWGTGDIGISDGNTGAPFGEPALWRVATLAWAPPQCVRQRRGSNPLFPWSEVSEIFTTSVWLSRARSISCAVRQTKIYFAAQVRRYCELRRVRSAIGIRLLASFPPAGPALLGTRLSGASPGIRVSRSGFRRGISNEPCFGQ
jgi:hypothetical protein